MLAVQVFFMCTHMHAHEHSTDDKPVALTGTWADESMYSLPSLLPQPVLVMDMLRTSRLYTTNYFT